MEFMEFFSAAMDAAGLIVEPQRLVFLIGGVLIGLALGVIPGLGGIVGMALLLPFTFDMDPYTAFAFLLGMGSVTTTSDTIPAVLFGVPGTAGSAATILDGHPLAKQGQAGRAFGAAYTASMMGGVFGALLLAVSILILRPVMLKVGAPELLAFSIFGLCMVAVLSGSAPLRGLAAAGMGLMIDMIGSDPQTGTLRWTMGTLYLWDGLPLVPVTLGIFALPELADLAISRRTIASGGTKMDSRTGQWEGVKDTFRHWWLVIRCAWLGSTLGAVPGLGAAIIDWIAYGHAARTEKGAEHTFGKGDIRGVLASEGANNAKEGGALVPTIAFGVPGSASMAILLGAFLIHGLVPGPDMLRQNLDVTYAIVWSVAFANIFGAGICFLASDQLARIALIRYSIIMPLILTVIMVGAFQARRDWGDLIAVISFGILGWIMKRLKWPRPPVILGVVLGHLVERYLNISMERYGDNWIMNSGLLFGTGRDVPLAPWQEIDSEAHKILSVRLAARRIVDFSGPHGWDSSSANLGRTTSLARGPDSGVEARLRVVQPLVELRVPFELDRDELENIGRGAKDCNFDPLHDAAKKMATAEDKTIFHGYGAANIDGINQAASGAMLTIPARYEDYPSVVAEAFSQLRQSGVTGPYAIALGPRCYTGLTKTMTGSGHTVLHFVEQLVGGPAVWAPAVDGAVIVSMRGGDFEMNVGQDISIGYSSHSGKSVQLYLQESFTFRVIGSEAAVPLVYPKAAGKSRRNR